MEDSRVALKDSDFDLSFLAEDPAPKKSVVKRPYTILVVDDDEEMHNATRLLLRNFRFEGRGLELIHAYSGEDARSILKKRDDIALIFLDVVMEENDTGLKIVDYIRKTLKNQRIRIVLRTGQPGEAPEERIISEYDINDYRLKTELTAQRLFTSVYEALRSYRDIMVLEQHRMGLEKIIQISARLFTLTSIEDFYSCILDQILNFRSPDASAIYFRENPAEGGVMFLDKQTFGTIIAATGKFSGMIGQNILEIEAIKPVIDQARNVQDGNQDAFTSLDSGYLFYKAGNSGFRSFIYIEGTDLDLDIEMIRVFLTNYALALDNYLVSQQRLQTQQEIISVLVNTIEGRPSDAGNHAQRVSRIAVLLAEELGLQTDMIETLQLASPLHDVGKQGIPQEILRKPDALDPEETQMVRMHSECGYQMLKDSDGEVLRFAAAIARDHHERFDGSGYPRGLSGEGISIGARIVNLADVFDTLTHRRSYQEAWTTEDAVAYIREMSGKQFDPVIVQALLKRLDEIIRTNDPSEQ